jgi:hypothetical protein
MSTHSNRLVFLEPTEVQKPIMAGAIFSASIPRCVSLGG